MVSFSICQFKKIKVNLKKSLQFVSADDVFRDMTLQTKAQRCQELDSNYSLLCINGTIKA